MTDKAVRVNLDDLVPGMVLAEDAIHMNGRVLLCAGICLTEKHLKIFKTWGLTEVYINTGETGVTKKTIEHIDPEIMAQSKAYMMKKFSRMDIETEFVSELFHICVKEHAEFLANHHE